jgi:8-oxo-dGTP diphosphatase
LKRIFPDRPILAVGAFIFLKNKLLLVKRKYPPDKEKWSIPGGAVKIGESLIEAVQREVKEECNIAVSNGSIVEIIDKIYYTKEKKIIFHYSIIDFSFATFGGEPKAGSDAEEIKFFTLEEILNNNNVAKSIKKISQDLYKKTKLPIYKIYKEKYKQN